MYSKLKGTCYYFVGLSGSGKTTLANSLLAHFTEFYPCKQVSMLDADEIRLHLSKGLGFSKEDRSANTRRIGYVASEIVRHGGLVIVANIAPYKEDRAYNNALISKYGNYTEIFVDTDLTICEERDPKGLYKAVRAGTLKNFTGISDPFEPPDTGLVLKPAALNVTVSDMLKKLELV